MAEPQEPQLPENSQEPKLHNASKVTSDIPIEHWEKLLIGKKMVDIDAPEDPTVRSRTSTDGVLLADYVLDFQAFRLAGETSIPSGAVQ